MPSPYLNGSVASAALGVLLLTPPGQSLTVEEIVADLRDRGFDPRRAYREPVYGGLLKHVHAGRVTRHRRDSEPWRYRISDSMREALRLDVEASDA